MHCVTQLHKPQQWVHTWSLAIFRGKDPYRLYSPADTKCAMSDTPSSTSMLRYALYTGPMRGSREACMARSVALPSPMPPKPASYATSCAAHTHVDGIVAAWGGRAHRGTHAMGNLVTAFDAIGHTTLVSLVWMRCSPTVTPHPPPPPHDDHKRGITTVT